MVELVGVEPRCLHSVPGGVNPLSQHPAEGTNPISFGLRPPCLNPLPWDMRGGVFLPSVRRTGSDTGCWRWFVPGHWHLALQLLLSYKDQQAFALLTLAD